MYFIGIDGGGAYSRLIAVDVDMKIVGRHAGSSANLGSIPYNTVRDGMKRLLAEFNRLTNTILDDCGGLCIGGAELGIPEQSLAMEDILKEIGVKCPIKTVDYGELVLAAETKAEPGVAVVAGTESLGLAVDRQGTLIRCGGLGHLIDDAGSGYWIGMKAIRAALMENDGRRPKTMLTDKIKEHFKINDITEILKIIYSDKFNKPHIAELTSLVKYAALNNDEAAIQIEDEAAQELYLIARSLIQRSKLTNCKVVIAGNVILPDERILQKMSGLIKSEYGNVHIVPLKEKTEMGAVHIAIRLGK